MEEPPASSPGGEWTQRKPWRSYLLRMSLEAAFGAPTQESTWRQPCQSSHPGMNLKAAMLELTPGDEAGTTVEELPPKDEPGGICGGAPKEGISLQVFVEELPTRDEPGGSGGGGTTQGWAWGAAVKEFSSGDQPGGSHGAAPPGWNEPRTHGRSWILIVGIEPRGPRGRSLRSNAPFTLREHRNNQSTSPWYLSPRLTTLISTSRNYRLVLRELIFP